MNLKRLGDQIDLLPEYMRCEAVIDNEGKVEKSGRELKMN